ncbi:MAG TPA: LamG-like jellyroll fold domain-containing protein [Candidatus Limnocylindria bacterium]|jgi:hypothetical protein|nr:LamG-like jellyroll fold domain-containing protein [Candidatus Limnocylindria bacterium]
MKQISQFLSRMACLVLAGLSLATTRADYSAQILAKSPLGYWRLNDNVVVPPADVAKNSGSLGATVDGYYVGAAVHPVAGALVGSADTAAAFDATAGTVVSVPYSSVMNPATAFSVEVWLNPGVENPAGTLTCAIASGQFASPRSGWLIYQSDTGWNFRMYNQNALNTSVSITGGPAPTAGTWAHVVVAYDGTNATMYVNGVQAATGTPAGTPTVYVPSAGGALFVGGRSDSSFWWNGSADELAIYTNALTATAVAAHYANATSATPATPYNQVVLGDHPVGYYRLDEPTYVAGTSPVAKNLGTLGADYNGTYAPGVDADAAGPRPPTYSGFEADNSAAGLNGNAGYVGTPYALNDLAEFTVAGWIKRGTIHSGRGGYFGQNDLLEIGDADSGANIEFYINAYAASIKIPYPFADNEWGLLAIVGDATHTVVYTNGFPAASMSHAVDSFGNSTYLFNIGGGGVFNVSGDYFLGSIDEVAVYDKALAASDLQALYFAADVAPVITSQPVAPTRTLVAGNVVTLSVGAIGTAPIRYQWLKGTNVLAGQTGSSLVFNSIAIADSGSYQVAVSNDFGSVLSTNVVLTVGPADSIAPTALYADGSRTFTTVRVWFSEPLDPISAQTASNYKISDGAVGLTVTAAKLAAPAGTPGDNMVDLTTAAQTAGKTYTVQINNVKDQTSPGNTIAANTRVTFKAWTLASGYLTFSHYDNLTGAADTDIDTALQDPRVIAGTPTTAGFLAGRFDTRTIFSDDSHENYFATMTGWITPTETDDYYFFLRSDDASRLYLSSNANIPNPATDTPIAIELDCCDPFYEPTDGDAATTAAPIRLFAGVRYGVLAMLKEGGGGDYLQVAWRKASDTTPAASLPYLPGEFLSTYVDPNTDLKFVTQPVDQPGVLPSPVVNFVTNNFTVADGGFTVINTDPAPPGPFAYLGGDGAWSADGSDDGCGGPFNSKLTSPEFTMPVTDEATLTFSHRYSFESGAFDGGQIWVSVNGGDFTPVSPDNFTANGYPPGTITGNGVLLGQRAFHDNSPGYTDGTFITSTVILGSFKANDKIVIQFVGAWDDCSGASHPSWVIRNLSIDYGTAPRATTFTAEGAATKQGITTAFAYQWQRNDGAGFVNIPNENAATFRIFPVVADFAATFRVVISVPGNELPSNTVKLTSGSTTPPVVSIAKSDTATTVTFTGTLQSSATVTGTFSDVPGATSPYTIPAGTGNAFYRSVK